MAKTNRKGYFVNKLKMEGITLDSTDNSEIKGVRKAPRIVAKEARERKKEYISHLEKRLSKTTS